jgi:hypothetical protein
MTIRLIVGVLAVAGVSTCGLLSGLTKFEIANKVNEKLPAWINLDGRVGIGSEVGNLIASTRGFIHRGGFC